jgi:hypothetical protein
MAQTSPQRSPRCPHPHVSLLDRSLAHLARWCRSWSYGVRVRNAREAGLAELNDLVARGELGCPPDLARYAVRESLPGPNWRFAEMLRRLGIRRRPGNAVRLTMLGARCATCTRVNECEAWLASGKTTGYCAFCPNARAIAELSSERPSPARR